MAGKIQAVVFQRVKDGQIRLLAAFFRFADSCLGRYLAIIGQVIGDALGILEFFKLTEALADVGGGELLLPSSERASSLAKSGAKRGEGADDAEYLVPA